MAPDLAKVRVGYELPEIRRTITKVSLFLFGVAHWTPHRIHWDDTSAQAAGFKGPLVTANLLSAINAELVAGWLGDEGRLIRLDERNVGSATAGDTVVATGRVTALTDGRTGTVISCALEMHVLDGGTIVTGEAHVLLPAD
ncbi:MaoC/PaaZ C-terminal domain-containing protein [Mycobacterium sp. 236(2023)]|uniref:MaoC/PaaZ C-terminal domain-containing protein n=1 Tax=Mycobacterium sp. 236(2023) TaxID=3038163 RepID=UPI0024151229|nr:MaoC/PaaZ C-terminal domain-containing protein [Mycobacterium sp. 236(2023)]MDG4668045.1 MaoC/PaaZ C-terminal domain-containing protein [Mycobacterium sp. 236(2023)]